MAMELHFTSATKGLKPGSTGFCTVALTAGMPAPMIQKLESLGGYRPVFEVGSPDEWKNPPVYAHWRVSIGGHFYSVLSHICFAGADHQGRFNKYAHHLVLDTAELTAAGPAWVMMQPEVMEKHWTGEPRILPANSKLVPSGTNPLGVCEQWKRVTGDAGWAGQLAQAFVLDATKPVYVIYNPGTDMLPLINEAIALLPEPMRWRVTFSTYFDQLQAGLLCSWRCCVAGTAAARAAPGNATSGVLIDLTAPLGEAPPNRFVDMARTGTGSSEGEQAGADRKFVVVSPPVGGWAPEKDSSPLFDDMLDEVIKPKPAQAGTPAPVLRVNQQQAAAARYVPPRRPNLLLWAGAILWPLLVLGVGFGIVMPNLAKPPAPPAQGEVAELAAKVKKLESDLGNQKGLIGELETGKERAKADADAKAGRIADLETQVATLTPEKDSLQNKLMTANLEINRLRGTQIVANTGSGSTTPRPDTGTKPVPKATSANASADGGISFVDMAKYRLVVKEVMGPTPYDRELTLNAPEGTAKLWFRGLFSEEIQVVNPSGSGGTDGRKVRILRAVQDSEQGLEIGTISLEGNQVFCKWPIVKVLGVAAAGRLGKLLDDAMPYAVLELQDASSRPLCIYQFCSKDAEAIAKPKVIIGKQSGDIPGGEADPVFANAQPGGEWQAQPDKDSRRKISFKHAKTQAVIDVEMIPEAGRMQIKAGWRRGSNPEEIQAQLTALEQREKVVLPREIERIEGEIAKDVQYLKENDPDTLRVRRGQLTGEILKYEQNISATIEKIHRRPEVSVKLKELEAQRAIERDLRGQLPKRAKKPQEFNMEAINADKDLNSKWEKWRDVKEQAEKLARDIKELEREPTKKDKEELDKRTKEAKDIDFKLDSGIAQHTKERDDKIQAKEDAMKELERIPAQRSALRDKQEVVRVANLTLWVVSKPSGARLAVVTVRSK